MTTSRDETFESAVVLLRCVSVVGEVVFTLRCVSVVVGGGGTLKTNVFLVRRDETGLGLAGPDLVSQRGLF